MTVRREMDSERVEPSGARVVDLLAACTRLLRQFFQTDNEVLIFPALGAGGLEAAVVNTFSPGDAALAVTVGVQGDRFARAAEQFGVDVRRLSLPRGKAVEPEQLADALEENSDVSAVLLTHNEFSTGVRNPIENLAPMIKERGMLLLVDATTAFGAMPLSMDDLGVDIVVAQSQAEWEMEPGLVMLAVSPVASELSQRAKLPRYYWDFGRARHWQEKGVGPYSASVPLVASLRDGLERLESQGLDRLQTLHAEAGREAREGVQALGLQLFADVQYASPTLTTVRTPTEMDADKLLEQLTAKGESLVVGGQAEMAGRILRIPHLGFDSRARVRAALEILGRALRDAGQTPDQ